MQLSICGDLQTADTERAKRSVSRDSLHMITLAKVFVKQFRKIFSDFFRKFLKNFPIPIYITRPRTKAQDVGTGAHTAYAANRKAGQLRSFLPRIGILVIRETEQKIYGDLVILR